MSKCGVGHAGCAASTLAGDGSHRVSASRAPPLQVPMTDLAAYAGLFAAAFSAATILPLQSEAAFAGLLLTGAYPLWALLLVASTGNIAGFGGQLAPGPQRGTPARQALVSGWTASAGAGTALVSPLRQMVPAIELGSGDRRSPHGRGRGHA